MTRYHTLSCPTCSRQKMVAVPSTTHFSCCKDFDVTVEAKRDGMLVNIVEAWVPKIPHANRPGAWSNNDPNGDTFGWMNEPIGGEA